MKSLTMLKFLKNEAGLSLPDIMIGGAIVAGLGLAVAQLSKDQSKAQSDIKADQDLVQFHARLAKAYGTAQNCSALFAAHGLYNKPLVVGTTLPYLAVCIPIGGQTTCNDVNRSKTGTVDTDQDANDTIQGSVMFPNSYIWTGNGTKRNWVLENIQISKAPTVSSGPVHVRMQYRRGLVGETTGKRVFKEIVMQARMAGGLFKECVDQAEASINNLQSDLCKTFNFGEASSNGTIAQWNDATQTCTIAGAKDCSSIGMSIDGIDSTGAVKCKPIVKDTDAAILQNTANTACPAGQKPQLQFDKSSPNPSNWKFKITCI